MNLGLSSILIFCFILIIAQVFLFKFLLKLIFSRATVLVPLYDNLWTLNVFAQLPDLNFIDFLKELMIPFANKSIKVHLLLLDLGIVPDVLHIRYRIVVLIIVRLEPFINFWQNYWLREGCFLLICFLNGSQIFFAIQKSLALAYDLANV